MLVFSVRRRLPFALTIALFLGGAFAGCVGGGDEVDPADAVFPGCEDAVMVTVDGNGTIAPADLVVSHPFTLCITNEDDEDRSFNGMPNKPPKPDYVPLPTVIDPHAEHRGGAAPVIEAFTIPAGETMVLGDIPYHGILMVHEMGNMDNFVVWEFLPEAERGYPVIENSVILAGSGSGDTDAGSVGSYAFDVTVPDLQRVKVELTWNDADDDETGGSRTNGEDTLEFRIIDPSGEVVKTKKGTAREGSIRDEYTLDITAFPKEVRSRGLSNATTVLAAERAPDLSAAGTWKIEVAVLSAPGAVPDDDGSTKGVTGGDGHQSWDVAVTAVHKWAWPLVDEMGDAADIVEADL